MNAGYTGGGRRAVVRINFLFKRSIGSIGFKHEGINHQSVFVGIMDALAILAMQLGFLVVGICGTASTNSQYYIGSGWNICFFTPTWGRFPI